MQEEPMSLNDVLVVHSQGPNIPYLRTWAETGADNFSRKAILDLIDRIEELEEEARVLRNGWGEGFATLANESLCGLSERVVAAEAVVYAAEALPETVRQAIFSLDKAALPYWTRLTSSLGRYKAKFPEKFYED